MSTTIFKDKCKFCGKLAVEKSRTFSKYLGKNAVLLECGHTIFVETVKAVDDEYHITSRDGRHLFPFQKEGVKFIERSNGRCLIADEMGLGKTVQALAFLKLHKDDVDENGESTVFPCLIIPKASVKFQWVGECVRWLGIEFVPSIIESSKDRPMPGFKICVATFDILRRMSGVTKQQEYNKYIGLPTFNAEMDHHPLAAFPFKTIIIDETQQIKSSVSLRTKEVRKIVKGIPDANGIYPRRKVIALSGTPAKNNAGEMFSILNILDNKRFPEYKRFVRRFCDQHLSGRTWKIGGIRDLETFQAYTADLIIRREMNDVLPDLPPINRTFRNVEFTGTGLKKLYKIAQDEFEEFYYGADKQDFSYITNLLAKIQKMRHITGLSKLAPIAEFLIEFIESTDRKYVIFAHHKDVVKTLADLIEQYADSEANEAAGDDDSENEVSVWKDVDSRPLELIAELSAEERTDLVTEFKNNPRKRIMICSALAAAEGINMQFVTDAGMMERQWNPANEEQAEHRFRRIGMGMTLPVNITYFISVGTIDEFFTELVEQKREYITSIFKEGDFHWDQSSLVKELADIIAMKGGKRWKLA